jgi:hypothetical protein
MTALIVNHLHLDSETIEEIKECMMKLINHASMEGRYRVAKAGLEVGSAGAIANRLMTF